ncbi:MAG: IclR family transcriptional regulator [Candidatus Rokubacteria bacterium]|nr:IclR family transcriptional regulator [Candidatus Rokubacteria bacterium]
MSMAKKAKSDYLIQSVSRALDLLEAFTTKEGDLGVTELARKLKLHKNNVFRLLATLETRGYVEQDRATERYRLAPKVYEVAAVYLQHLDVRRQARVFLEALALKCHETVCLGLLDRTFAVYVDMVESEQPVRVAPRLGRRFPAVAAAAGKVLLAALPREQQMLLLGPEAAPALLEKLERVNAAGYAVDDEECEVGVRSVAAPIHDPANRALGAIEVSAPAMRLSLEQIDAEIAPLVLSTAREVEARLGAKPAT